MSAPSRVMLVTDRTRAARADLAAAVARAVEGGLGLVQLREKDLDDLALERLARRISGVVVGRAALLVNGSTRVARGLGAGVHLPASASGIEAAAARLRGEIASLGRSAHSVEEARALAGAEPLDYLVFGHVWETPSKPGRAGRGLEALARVAEAVAPLPVYAIGGARPGRVADALRAGAWGVAACGAILGAADPCVAAVELESAVRAALDGVGARAGERAR